MNGEVATLDGRIKALTPSITTLVSNLEVYVKDDLLTELEQREYAGLSVKLKSNFQNLQEDVKILSQLADSYVDFASKILPYAKVAGDCVATGCSLRNVRRTSETPRTHFDETVKADGEIRSIKEFELAPLPIKDIAALMPAARAKAKDLLVKASEFSNFTAVVKDWVDFQVDWVKDTCNGLTKESFDDEGKIKDPLDGRFVYNSKFSDAYTSETVYAAKRKLQKAASIFGY